MPRYCPIKTCVYFKGCSDPNIRFSRPTSFAMRDRWIDAIQKFQEIDPKIHLCQLHFDKKCFKISGKTTTLTKDAMPTIFQSASDTKTPEEPLLDIEKAGTCSETHLVDVIAEVAKVRYCSFKTCVNFTGCRDPSIRFFKPDNVEMRDRWNNAIQKYQKTNYYSIVLCELHFEEKYYRGKYKAKTKDAVPTIFGAVCREPERPLLDIQQASTSSEAKLVEDIVEVTNEEEMDFENIHEPPISMQQMDESTPSGLDKFKHGRKCVRRVPCTVCTTKFEAVELEEHMCDGLDPVQCENCKQSFTAMKSLLQHLDECTKEIYVYKCHRCYKTFRMKFLLDYHKKCHGIAIPYVCDICERSLGTQQSLTAHRKRHNRTLDYLCDKCGKRFPTERYLRLHEGCHKEKTFKCSKCDFKCSREESLKLHIARHANTKFVCEICDAVLVTNISLIRHMGLHKQTVADKPTCTICSKEFIRPSGLQKHMRAVHISRKPYICEFCDRTFKYGGDLNKHKRQMHLGDDMYACPDCPKRFRNPFELKRHRFGHYTQPQEEPS